MASTLGAGGALSYLLTRSTSSPAVLIDMAGVTLRELSFDIDNGWSWGGASWAQQFSSDIELASVLYPVRNVNEA